jgi:hypothetical protein
MDQPVTVPTATVTARPRHGGDAVEGTGHTRMPLRDVLARLEAGLARHAATISLPPTVVIDGDHGRTLRSLLLEAAGRRYDTVRVHVGPDRPVIAVSRRRLRPRRHTM